MPKIITARDMDLAFTDRFGDLGPEFYVTGHWSAGPPDTSDQHAITLVRSYHQGHAAKDWGGAGYHYAITRRGTILCLRPTWLKGAHVGDNNSNNIGVLFLDGQEGREHPGPTIRQRRSYKWLLANAHTRRMPAAHRTDRDLRTCKRYGHNNWKGHESNECPGIYKRMIVSGGTAR